MMELSPQRRWQLRKQALGRCVICGRKADGKTTCQKHAKQSTEWHLKHYHELRSRGLCGACGKRKSKKCYCEPCRKKGALRRARREAS